ncbi:type I restriction-modification system [Vibrio sp. JCM 19236]|nr:type I restriction-modification system [Vibrio sp. JCM 19236]
MEEKEVYQGPKEISDRFEMFIHLFCNGYKYTLKQQPKFDDESLNTLIEKIKGALEKNLISYSDVAEVAFDISLSDSNFETQIPNELVTLGCGLMSGNIKDIYCPFTASYRFAETLAKNGNEVYFEPSNTSELAIPKLSADLRDAKYHQEWADSNPVTDPAYIESNGLKQFSHTVALPPFGLKYPKDVTSSDMFGRFPEKSLMGEVLQLRHMLAQTQEQVVTFVVNGFLSRTAAGEKQFKQDMIKQGLLHSVIALPEKLFNNTMVQVNALVFDKRKQAEHVLFIDASGENFAQKAGKRTQLNHVEEILALHENPDSNSALAVKVTPDDIINNDFNLLPSRYVLSAEQKDLNHFLATQQTITLSEIAELIGPQAIKVEADGENKFYEFGLNNLNDIGIFTGKGKKVSTNSQASRAQNQLLQEDDIVIVNKGSVGKVAFVEQVPSDNAMPSQAFTIVRLDKRITDIKPVALFQYLLSPLGQLQLQSMASGATVTMIGTKDLKNMRIPLFSKEQAQEASQIRAQVKQLHNQLYKIEQNIKQLNRSRWFK